MEFLKTLDVISRFTDTAIITSGKTYFTDASSSFFGCVESSTPDNAEVGFYENIPNFQRVVSLFESPEISLQDSVLVINDTVGDAKFVTSDVRLIRNLQTMDAEKAVTQTISVEPTLKVQVTKDIIQRIRTAASAIPNSKVVIQAKGDDIRFVVKDVDVLMSTPNTYKFKVEGVSSKDCSVVVDAGFFVKMQGEFELSLAFSAKSSTFRAVLKNDEVVVVIPTAHTA